MRNTEIKVECGTGGGWGEREADGDAQTELDASGKVFEPDGLRRKKTDDDSGTLRYGLRTARQFSLNFSTRSLVSAIVMSQHPPFYPSHYYRTVRPHVQQYSITVPIT